MPENWQNDTTIITLLFAGAIGLSVALIAWIISKALAAVPAEDREYKDPAPLGFRFVWWPIQWISFYISVLITGKAYNKLLDKLRKAGLDYCISPGQFVATRILSAGIVGVLFYWVLGSFDNARQGESGISTTLYWQITTFGAFLGWFYPAIWLRDRLAARQRELFKALPFYLDIITLCVEAGLNMQGAMNQAVIKGQADRHHGADHDLLVTHDGFIADLPDAQQRGLGCVQDRRFEVTAVAAEIADCEGPAVHILACQLA